MTQPGTNARYQIEGLDNFHDNLWTLLPGLLAINEFDCPTLFVVPPSGVPENSCVLRRTHFACDRSCPGGVCFEFASDIDRSEKFAAAGGLFRGDWFRLVDLAFGVKIVTMPVVETSSTDSTSW